MVRTDGHPLFLLCTRACASCSGYDFGYLLKILTCQPLPASEAEFFELLNLYFPNIFDIKYLMKFCDNLHGGLNKLAEMLEVGTTCQVFGVQQRGSGSAARMGLCRAMSRHAECHAGSQGDGDTLLA